MPKRKKLKLKTASDFRTAALLSQDEKKTAKVTKAAITRERIARATRTISKVDKRAKSSTTRERITRATRIIKKPKRR